MDFPFINNRGTFSTICRNALAWVFGIILSVTPKNGKVSRSPFLQQCFFLFVLSTTFTTVSAVDLTLDNSLDEISGDLDEETCQVGDVYRLGTTSSYNGQALDLLLEITAEDNEFDELAANSTGPCISVASGIVETRLRDRDADNDIAFMDLKFTVVLQGTTTPLEVDRIVFSAFDLDTNGGTGQVGTATDDIYMIDPSRGYIEAGGASNVAYNEGAYGSGYDIRLEGQTTGNCNDSATNPEASCRGGGIAINGAAGPNKVTEVNIRVSNDNAYGLYPNDNYNGGAVHRLIQLSFKEVDFNEILSSSIDHGDIPAAYGDAYHTVSVFTVLGYGLPADSENAQYSTTADLDDQDPSNESFDDEDGVRIDGQAASGSLLGMTVGRTHSIDVTSIGNGYLSAWLDINGDGDFSDAGEQILTDEAISSTVAMDTSIIVPIPSGNYTGTSYARFRFSQNPGVNSSGDGGIGEVEDYQVYFNPGGNILGHLYEDVNGNGTQDNGEPNLSNIAVLITDSAGAPTVVRTDANGDYIAVGIRPGVATVDIDENDSNYPTGAVLTEGTDSTNVTVIADTDNVEENNGLYIPPTVSGTVNDSAAAGIAGVTISIQDTSGNSVNDTSGNPLTTTTDTNGNYLFENVPAGDFLIVEIDPTNHFSVSDGDSSADGDNNQNTNTNDNQIPVSIISGKADSDNNFVDELNNPKYNMVKTSDTAAISLPGTITYTFTFTNTGNVALFNLDISDPDAVVSGCPISNLAVGASDTCTGTRVITQAQLDSVSTLPNTATPIVVDSLGANVTEDDIGDNTTTTIVLQYPVATDDSQANTGFPSPTNPTILSTIAGNDSDSDGTIQTSSIDLDPSTSGVQSTITNADGTYTADASGNVTFTPNASLTANPTPINYTVNDNDGLTSNTATLTVTYSLSADISVSKALITAGPHTSGQTLTYEIIVSNLASSAGSATNIVVTDLVTNLLISNVSSPSCSSLPCTIPILAVGESETITVQVIAP